MKLFESLMVDISMVVMCHANVIVGCNRRRSELSHALLNRKYDNSRTEQ